MDQDATHLVERLDVLEERIGIRLDGLFAWISGPDDDGDYRVEMNGEVYANSGAQINQAIWITLAIYDARGRVVGTGSSFIDDDSFFGFEAFSITEFVKSSPSKLRIYPKL